MNYLLFGVHFRTPLQLYLNLLSISKTSRSKFTQVTLGIAFGITLGITLGKTLGKTLGITLGVTLGITLGVTLGITLGTLCVVLLSR